MNSDQIEHWLFTGTGADANAFFRDYWLRKPFFVHRNAEGLFDSIITRHDIDELLTSRNPRYPEVSMALAGKKIMPASYSSAYTINGVTTHCIEPQAVAELFEKGASLLLRAIHTGMPSVAEMTHRLESRFRKKMTAICFVSPPNGASFPRHTDPTASLVFQVSGSKHWFIPSAIDGVDMKLITMEPGSVLYLPPNWPHYVTNADAISISMNYSIETPTWRDLLQSAVSEILDDPAFDRAVDSISGLSPDAMDPARTLLAERLASLDQAQLMQMLDDDFERKRLSVGKSIFSAPKERSS